MKPPKLSRPAARWPFGKRTQVAKTTLDEETLEMAQRKARALGYDTLAEFLADVITANVRGVDTVANLHAQRLRRAVEIGPVTDQLGEG